MFEVAPPFRTAWRLGKGVFRLKFGCGNPLESIFLLLLVRLWVCGQGAKRLVHHINRPLASVGLNHDLLVSRSGAHRSASNLPNPLRILDSLLHSEKLPLAPVIAPQSLGFNIQSLGGRVCTKSNQSAPAMFLLYP